MVAVTKSMKKMAMVKKAHFTRKGHGLADVIRGIELASNGNEIDKWWSHLTIRG